MSTLAQITANQANAKHSTGPVTPQGKSRVARNAIRHGLTAKHLVVDDDEHEEFEDFQQSLIEELDPQGAVETITFHELLHAAWNLRRYRRIEAALATRGVEEIFSPVHAAAADRLNRYQGRAQRAFYRALQELRTLQAKRPLPAATDNAARPTPPAVTGKSTKQTQSEVNSEGFKHAIDLPDLAAGLPKCAPAETSGSAEFSGLSNPAH